MTLIEEYKMAVKQYLENRENNSPYQIEHISSQLALSFLNCLNLDFVLFDQIKAEYEQNHVERNSIEYFIYLESILWKRFYENRVSKSNKKVIISQNSKIFCEEALNLYSNAYVSSYLLANYYESNKEYDKAKKYIENTGTYTEIPTQNFIKNMVYINAKLKDWESVDFYKSQLNNVFFRISINFAILMERYFAFRLIYFLPLLVIFIFIKSWFVTLPIIFLSISCTIFFMWKSKDQLLRKTSIIVALDFVSILILSSIIRALLR